MALEVVWRNPIPRPRAANSIELAELDRGRSIYIAHIGDEVLVLRIDHGRTYRPVAEAKRVGGA